MADRCIMSSVFVAMVLIDGIICSPILASGSIGDLVRAIELGHSDNLVLLLNQEDAPSETRSLGKLTSARAWINSGKFQGDIDGVDPLQFKERPEGIYHNAVNLKSALWPNGRIPYLISNEYKSWERDVLLKAFETYNQNTCIQFVPRTTENDYLDIKKGYGCYSQVGRTQGRQEVSLGRGCLYHEIVVHEVMHAVGFWHEHSRADRDQFIQIQYQNIMPGMRGQFEIITPEYQDLLGLTYDYKSVMHYDSKAFSANGQNTIVTTQDGFTTVIGTATDLSEMDLAKINKLYSCPAKKRAIKPIGPTTHRPTDDCADKFLDCPFFNQYCTRSSFVLIMQTYCPKTCNYCQ